MSVSLSEMTFSYGYEIIANYGNFLVPLSVLWEMNIVYLNVL